MTDLLQFLRDRYTEVAQRAEAAGDSGYTYTEDDPLDIVSDADARHIAQHSPFDVLSDVAAKLDILRLHSLVHRDVGWLDNGDEETSEILVCGTCVPKHSHYGRREDVPEGPCSTVRLLGRPHSAHPDYRDEWRP
ncbi:DUF6221 family protein [Streptomyces sp. NPDC048389]|uniref:DUF6221 family protein n=1 Tax=Streptomyces sp. NPDC048389 TaxID=3154622 RepID=UPI0034533410